MKKTEMPMFIARERYILDNDYQLLRGVELADEGHSVYMDDSSCRYGISCL